MTSAKRERAAASSVPALVDARSSWACGDFNGCLARLDAIGSLQPGSGPWVEATLLRARSLYRLKRYDETIALLEPVESMFAPGDESCTARVLLGSAIARAGDVDRGLRMLEAAAAQAESLGVHPAIRAEITHGRALAYWTRRDLDESERFAREAEAAGADIISVRATQLRGFVAVAQRRFTDALALFNATVDAYWRCRERDTDLVEIAVLDIAALELMLRSSAVRGSHDMPDRRRVRDRWEASPAVSSVAAQSIVISDAWLFAHDGDRDTAFRKMRLAEEMAPVPAWRVFGLATRAGLALAFDEVGSAREHAALATEISNDVDWNATIGEERVALLLLAEVMSVTDPAAASAMLDIYDGLPAPMDPGNVISTDPRLPALEDYARGLVLRSRGDAVAAKACLKSAADRFASCGHLWRYVQALIALESVSPGAGHIETARAIVSEHFPKSFLARRVALGAASDLVVRGLTPAQRDVLSLLLQGLNAREIATRTGRAYNTVRVHIDRLREAFKTSSIHAMVVECHRRGIVLPAPAASRRKDESIRHCG
jgi:DNA-binding NarL/FixJ family response regulator